LSPLESGPDDDSDAPTLPPKDGEPWSRLTIGFNTCVTARRNFPRLAQDYAAANYDPIAAKLAEVAAEFEAKAAALERGQQARDA
jgi:hypothetical protein